MTSSGHILLCCGIFGVGIEDWFIVVAVPNAPCQLRHHYRAISKLACLCQPIMRHSRQHSGHIIRIFGHGFRHGRCLPCYGKRFEISFNNYNAVERLAGSR